MSINGEDLIGQSVFVLDPAGINLVTSLPTDVGFPTTRTLRRGESFVITEELLEFNSNRFGESWIPMAADEDLQHLRWGKQRIALAWPDGEDVHVRGSVDALARADVERARAYNNLSGAELTRALRDITARFGFTGTSSSTLSTDPRTAAQARADFDVDRKTRAAELHRQAEQNIRPLGGAA